MPTEPDPTVPLGSVTVTANAPSLSTMEEFHEDSWNAGLLSPAALFGPLSHLPVSKEAPPLF